MPSKLAGYLCDGLEECKRDLGDKECLKKDKSSMYVYWHQTTQAPKDGAVCSDCYHALLKKEHQKAASIACASGATRRSARGRVPKND